MIRGWLLLVVGAWAGSASAHSMEDLSLSDAWATPVWMQHAMLDETEGDESWTAHSAPEEAAVASAVPAPVPLDSTQMGVERARFRQGTRIHRVGNILVIAGGALAVPAGLYTVLALGFGGGSVELAAFVTGLGLSAYFTGGVLSSWGGIQATNAVNNGLGLEISRSAGIGGMVVTLIGVPVSFTGIALATPIVGVIMGAAQMKRAKRALAGAGLIERQFTSTAPGFAVSGRL